MHSARITKIYKIKSNVFSIPWFTDQVTLKNGLIKKSISIHINASVNQLEGTDFFFFFLKNVDIVHYQDLVIFE